MKIACLSDLHGLHNDFMNTSVFALEMLESDVIIFAGDMSNYGTKDQCLEFLTWFNELPTNAKRICIPGNHDLWMDTNWKDRGLGRRLGIHLIPASQAELDELKLQFQNISILINESVEYNGFVFYGNPYSPKFGNWAFDMNRDETWNIPENTDVLITHSPLYQILDKVKYPHYGEDPNVGSLSLRNEVDQLSIALHVTGHIHEAYGIQNYNNTICVNASICNFDYFPINDPIFINLAKY